MADHPDEVESNVGQALLDMYLEKLIDGLQDGECSNGFLELVRKTIKDAGIDYDLDPEAKIEELADMAIDMPQFRKVSGD